MPQGPEIDNNVFIVEGLTVMKEKIITIPNWANFTGETNNKVLSMQKEEKKDAPYD